MRASSCEVKLADNDNATPCSFRSGAVLFDLPSVIEQATPQLRDHGILERCEIIGGDFFAEVPAGADAYLLKHVVHDWDDDRATEILRSCRRAMGRDATLLIVEGVYPARIDQSEESRGAASNDVNPRISTGGGTSNITMSSV
jgi:hypothetical protein